MRPVIVVLVVVVVEDGHDMPLVDDQDAVEEFATRAADEALGDRVGSWCAHRGLNDADIERGEDGVEPGGELGIAIPEEDRTRRPASPRSSDGEQRGAAGIAASADVAAAGGTTIGHAVDQ